MVNCSVFCNQAHCLYKVNCARLNCKDQQIWLQPVLSLKPQILCHSTLSEYLVSSVTRKHSEEAYNVIFHHKLQIYNTKLTLIHHITID